MNSLSLLKRKQIDEQKWNALITTSVQSLPYAFTWYLDAVAENWEALVLNDYEAVMPLPWLRKLAIKCVYQPYYCQQLGVFSKKQPTGAVLKQTFEALSQFSYINLNLNPSAALVAGAFIFKKKKNLLLDLDKDYTVLRKGFSENHRRNIAKAEKNQLQFIQHVELKQFQQFYLQNVVQGNEIFKPQHEKIFKTLTKTVTSNKTGQVFAAALPNGELTTAVLLLFHQNRAINIINTSSAEGKKNGSSHFLFDRLIQELANNNSVIAREALRAKQSPPFFTLDFEGSSIPGIARFYEGFGAREEVFYNYQTSVIKKLSQRFG